LLTFRCLHHYIFRAFKFIYTSQENTKEIMSVKEFVYLIQNHADLHKF
jgi:hypothetical protein